MDIIEIIVVILQESATAALALFAIWVVKYLYERRIEDHDEHAALRIQERDDYAIRMERVNCVLLEKLEEGNKALAVNTEVVRQNNDVMHQLLKMLENGR